MSEKYRLGLTRNRLFEFDNCVVFSGRYDDVVDVVKGGKALGLLSLKEPLITAKVELQDNGEAFAVTEMVSQEVIFSEQSLDKLLDKYETCGLNFWEKLFEFSVSSDGYFVIAGHTCVSDAKSLLRIAVSFSEIYKSNAFSVKPSDVNVISEKIQLPIEVLSPLTDKLSLELESKWTEKAVVFGIEDYKKAKRLYNEHKDETATLKAVLCEDTVSNLKLYAKENDVDVSSVVGFAFYEALCANTYAKESVCKMNVYGDLRFFFENGGDFAVGAFDGVVSAYLRKKDKKKSLDERMKAFHVNVYKGVTSTFKVFYDDVFMMPLSPSLCDSAYMWAAGCFKNKTSKKLAENYGCKCEKMCDYFSCNLDQAYWAELKHYSDVSVKAPLKMRSYSYLGFVAKDGKGIVTFSYKKSVYDDEKAERIFKNAIDCISQFE